MTRGMFTSLAAVAVVLSLSACASHEKREAEEKQQAQLKQRVEKAEFSAMEAQRKAEAAQREADEAKAAAEENNAKIDRAFEKSQEK